MMGRKLVVAGLVVILALVSDARAAASPGQAGRPLAFSTYLGGSGDEADWSWGSVVAIAVDAAGNSYVTGTTGSPDFPTTPGNDGPLQGEDAFVTKLSPSGEVIYSTRVGGVCDDVARAIAVDAAGNAYITGRANGGFCPVGVEPGVLVAKLDPTGTLDYALVFGGAIADTSIGQGIAVDPAGNAYVTGVANASPREFPTTAGTFRTQSCDDVWGTGDGFVAKVDAAGTGLLYATYLCGTGNDSPNGIAIDATGAVYVAGTTDSHDFPTVDALQPDFPSPDGISGFITKLSPDGGQLVYSTYLGGSTDDAINGIARDALGNLYVTGETASEDFPTTPGVVQERPGARLCVPIGPCTDAFVTKLDPSGGKIVWSTYLYGELDDAGSGIGVDGAGNVFVVGTTASWHFPVLRPLQPIVGGTFDAFVVELSADGTHLVYSSPLGGSTTALGLLKGWDEGSSIAVDAAGNAWVAGTTQSDDFPTTPGAFQTGLGGGGCDAIGLACRDAFVTRIDANRSAVTPSIRLSAAPRDIVPGGTLTATWAGMPAPTASDRIDLWVLGGGGVLGGAAASWPTGGIGNGTLQLRLPPDLGTGTYELRLMTPDPDYFDQPTAVAESEPIRVAAAPPTTTSSTTSTSSTTVPSTSTTSPTTTLHPTTTTTLPPAALCETAGLSVCDDGDPCTVDACVAGVGCVSAPASGLASVTCTCRRVDPPACDGAGLPPSVVTRQRRVCGLFDGAAASADPTLARRRLRRAVRNLKDALASLSRARRKGLSDGCARALDAGLRDAKSRAEELLGARSAIEPSLDRGTS
jgi:hypothetical protein